MESPVAKIVGKVSRIYGIEFFEQLLLQLNEVVHCHFSFIAKFNGYNQVAVLPILASVVDQQQVKIGSIHFSLQSIKEIEQGHSLILSQNGADFIENLETFSNIEGLELSSKTTCIAVPLFDSKDQVVGVIATLANNNDSQFNSNKGLLQLFSGRVGAEIERFEQDLALREANKALDEDHRQKLAELERASKDLDKARYKLVETEKMAALGDLVAGVAHEVNTPLGVAITAESFLTESFEHFKSQLDGGKLSMADMTNFVAVFEQSVPMIAKNLRRSKEIIDNFKKMASDQIQLTADNVPLSAYYERLISTLTPLFKRKKVQVTFEGCDQDVLNTYPGCHAQLITNLVTNSIQHGFVEEGATNQISIKLSHGKQGEFVVDYQDNGVGISNEIFNRILEPFFTTSRNKGNSGLGLPIAYNLVTANLGGKFECVPSDTGAHFRYHFAAVPSN